MTKLELTAELVEQSLPFLSTLIQNNFVGRLASGDSTLWGEDAQEEAAQRLGWVDPFSSAAPLLERSRSLRSHLLNSGVDRIVLCGMGGSSLGPEVVARESDSRLIVLDATHPDEVLRQLRGDLTRTAVVVSSKSGSTVETASHAAAFKAAFRAAGIAPQERMIFVTDPGSPLSQAALDGYEVFLADPNIGGRFSVLSAFGIVPTVLAGADMGRILDDAASQQAGLLRNETSNPALQLASAIVSQLPSRYVLLLKESESARWGLGSWIEQLVAESTGKQGLGVLPVALEPIAEEFTTPPSNSLIVGLSSADSAEAGLDITVDAPLGAQFLLWEIATAAIGHLMGINPFDQPDVESAKSAARSLIDKASESEQFEKIETTADIAELTTQLAEVIPEGGYLAIQAFVDRDGDGAKTAIKLRDALSKSLQVPVSLGWAPRYLHSVGQLHKGGPALGAYLQLIDSPKSECEIPGATNGFGALLKAQARGDRKVLTERGRPVLVRTV